MCCGQDEGPRLAAVTTEEPMAKVYTAVPGAVLSIGGYGMASNEQAAEVPESVAAELAGRDDLVIVRSQQASPAPADYAAALQQAAESGTDFVIPEDNPPASPAKRARKAQE